jgi:hypothetical protein
VGAIERLYVVYNADSDLWSLLVDVARKLAGRDECPLCTLTHGATGERAAWRECKQALRVPVDAVHRDELTGELRQIAAPLPFVAARVAGKLELLLERADIEELRPEMVERALRERAAARGFTFPE